MTKTKIFIEMTTYFLECEINDWVKENNKKIISVTTTKNNSNLVASVVYEV